MKVLFDSADWFLKESDWKDLALIKFCLFSMGVLVGTQLPEKYRKPAGIAATCVFSMTYGPLMLKYFGIVKENLK